MTHGRTVWWAKDAGWWRRGGAVNLCTEFGGVAGAIIDWLTCEAKLQDDGGYVRASYDAIAHGAFVDVVTVRHVVSRAVALGLLDEHQEHDRYFDCRISGWHEEQEKALGAIRSKRYRDRKASESPANDDDPSGAARSVTERDASRSDGSVTPTGQDRTAQSSSLREEPREGEIAKASEDVRRLCSLLANSVRSRDPKFDAEAKAASAAWLRPMRLLIENDRQGDVAEVEHVLRWSQQDDFWQSNVLSPQSLRRSWDKLRAKAGARGLRVVGAGRPSVNDGFAEAFAQGVDRRGRTA